MPIPWLSQLDREDWGDGGQGSPTTLGSWAEEAKGRPEDTCTSPVPGKASLLVAALVAAPREALPRESPRAVIILTQEGKHSQEARLSEAVPGTHMHPRSQGAGPRGRIPNRCSKDLSCQ